FFSSKAFIIGVAFIRPSVIAVLMILNAIFNPGFNCPSTFSREYQFFACIPHMRGGEPRLMNLLS
ncbi:MAG: hypothetical protein NT075_28850, partial [Chloroflexi bacterium]|nr:hypothetical protein [Chloroflexota bacterium]